MRRAGLGRIGARRDIGEAIRRVRAHRLQIAARGARGPQSEVGREPFGRVPVGEGRIPGFGEGFHRFWRAKPAHGIERVAVGDMQPLPPLAPRRLGFDLLDLAKRCEQRLRLGDLGHFGRRRKAFEGGREDGVGFDGTPSRLIELGQR